MQLVVAHESSLTAPIQFTAAAREPGRSERRKAFDLGYAIGGAMAGDVEQVDRADDRVRRIRTGKFTAEFAVKASGSVHDPGKSRRSASIVLATNILRSSMTVRDHRPMGKGLPPETGYSLGWLE